jgi:hypothetical protein
MTMDIEELQRRWQEQERRLDAALRLNVRVVRELETRKVQSMLGRLTAEIAVELSLNVVTVLLVGSYLGGRVGAWRFVVPAVALLAGAVALVVAQAAQIARIRSIDYATPVVAIQKQLERVRVLRLRTAKWIVLLAPLCWTPLVIVAADALFGVDLYAVAPLWLALNAVFGVVAIPSLMWLARRRMLQPLTRHLDARALTAARRFLDSLADFEAEPR